MVGVTRLELAAPRPPVWCATTCATPRLLLYYSTSFSRNQYKFLYIRHLFLVFCKIKIDRVIDVDFSA